MFTVTLGDKKYKVEKVTARTLREIGAAQAVFKRWTENPEAVDMKKDMDTLIGWFCVLCGNQFSAEDVYDNYPGDKIITDIGLALASVNAQVTEVLKAFPTESESKKKVQKKKTTLWSRFFSRFTGIFAKKAVSRKK